jgi:hypothetical protein
MREGEREKEKKRGKRDRVRDMWRNVSGWEKIRISSPAKQVTTRGKAGLSFILSLTFVKLLQVPILLKSYHLIINI